MIKWIKTEWALEAVINGREYEIQKSGATYNLYRDGVLIGTDYTALISAKTAAKEYDMPTQPKPGIHIDDIAGQQLVDILKRSFTTARIQDFIDASPYDEPDTGAPEGGPLG